MQSIASEINGKFWQSQKILKSLITILKESNSCGDNSSGGSGSDESSHSSSSSGGADGSPEPQSNVETKEISQAFVTSGKPCKV